MECIDLAKLYPEEYRPAKRVRLPGGRFLQTLHQGPYADLHATYALLEEHAARAGLRPGACREIYLSDPRRTAPERLKTLVRIGVE